MSKQYTGLNLFDGNNKEFKHFLDEGSEFYESNFGDIFKIDELVLKHPSVLSSKQEQITRAVKFAANSRYLLLSDS